MNTVITSRETIDSVLGAIGIESKGVLRTTFDFTPGGLVEVTVVRAISVDEWRALGLAMSHYGEDEVAKQ